MAIKKEETASVENKTRVVKGDKNTTSKAISKTNKGIRVTKGTVKKKGKDTYMYMTLEDGMILVFKNNVLIGGIK